MASIDFSSLYFGRASAEYEVARDPDRFFSTFLDRWSIRRKVREHEFFLIVGPKGVGKTAISEYIRLSLVAEFGPERVFAQTVMMDEAAPNLTPITSLTNKLVSGQAASTTDAAWKLFIAIRFFEMMMDDAGSSLANDDRAVRLRQELRSLNILDRDFPSVLRTVRENKVKISWSFFSAQIASRKEPLVSVSQLGSELIGLVVDCKSESSFVLAIDGLDRIIVDNDAYWLTLAALLRVGSDIHLQLIGANSSVHLHIMCRSDVLRRIEFSDTDKITGDATLFVGWDAHDPNSVDSPLWDYLAHKAKVPVDVLIGELPESINVGARGKMPRDIPILEYLLQATRSTPREITMLMKNIQDHVPDGGRVSPERVRAGVDAFSRQDLLSTVTAEATGMFEDSLGRSIGSVVANLAFANGLRISDVRNAVARAGQDPGRAVKIAKFLFLAGLIGNLDPGSGYVQFYHRRDTHEFNAEGPWRLHIGLMYAFNIPWARS